MFSEEGPMTCQVAQWLAHPGAGWGRWVEGGDPLVRKACVVTRGEISAPAARV